jgi:hypothetical protein
MPQEVTSNTFPPAHPPTRRLLTCMRTSPYYPDMRLTAAAQQYVYFTGAFWYTRGRWTRAC